MEDFDEIKRTIDNVKDIYAYSTYATRVSNRRGEFETYLAIGTTGMKDNYSDQEIIRGRYFTDSDYYAGSWVCIIHEDSAKALFGNVDVLGMTIEFNFYGMPVELEIIGVRKEEELTGVFAYLAGSVEEVLGYDPSRITLHLELPDTVIMSRFGIEKPAYSDFTVISETAESQHQVAQDVVDYMEEKFDCKGKGLIRVESFGDYMGQINQVLDYVTLFIGLVAAISLVVGGIGVMNIMLVSVTERTREIGIRKALGARTSSIMLQFLSESAIITLLGGIIGILLGVGGAALICKIIGFSVKVSAGAVVGASAFSAGVGIFFGLYPARKAAKLSPIEALRHE